ncbi:unnamed protein product [Didymodactylos carnosus]|uniref:F-BAR domain-containing protein n=1 Tax=Didymodactylos carnosus TaxID=1234261 RepID=A0A814IHP7_9BILA|nr:unnamed protein product [Didymodactylos carnosus]CAF1021783.1 unnamed protein product [Didymodactylos carnosus]CAF3697351.1 unnamed protein product [Didymodactylos carnosus]CAF3793202.1 unnamed protein product [Didymodactylos carnosus]
MPQTTPELLLSNPWYGKGFFEPNQYKVSIERCNNGYHSCELFLKFIEQRIKIERDYMAELKKWSLTCQKEISRSQDYGTNKSTWSASIVAGEQHFYTHSQIAKDLQENVLDKMTQYRKDNYGKSVLHIKKAKEFEKDFEQAQRSWLKLLQKIDDTKKLYQETKKKLKKFELADKIIQSDTGTSDEQKRKAKDQVDTLKKECTAQESKYKQLIEDMKNQRPNYEKEMTNVLNRTHDFEKKRSNFFKQMFQEYHDALYPNKPDENLAGASQKFLNELKKHNVENDIAWWNKVYGSDTNTQWPEFEELKDSNT